MRFRDWFESELKARNLSATKLRRELAERSGVSITTIAAASVGARLSRFHIAQNLAKCTDGKVTAEELCQ